MFLLIVSSLWLMAGHGADRDEGKASDRPSRAYESLVADLKSDDSKVNDRALSCLVDLAFRRDCGKLGNRKQAIVQALVPYLDNAEVRKDVLFIIGRFGPDAKSAVPHIREFLKPTTDDRLAIVAQYALRDIGADAATAVPDLIASSAPFFFGGHLDNLDYRRALPLTLVAMAPCDRRVRQFLRIGLNDDDIGVRVNSAWSFWKLGVRTDDLKKILAAAQKEKEPYIREHVGIVLAYLARESPEVLPMALSSLKDSDRSVRNHVLDVLVEGGFTQVEVREAYIERLRDPDPSVRMGACEGLGKMKGKAARSIPQLKKLLQDKELKVRVWAARALHVIDPSMTHTYIDVLVEGLSHSSNHIRAYAAEGLQELGPRARSALPALRCALRDEWPAVRRQAADAIKAIENASPTPSCTKTLAPGK